MSIKFHQYIEPGTFTEVVVGPLTPTVAALVQRLELRNFPMPVKVVDSKTAAAVDVVFDITDRHDGTPQKLTINLDLSDLHQQANPTAYFLRAVRTAIMHGVQHELDECLFFDDKQVHDPHGGL